MISYVNSVQSSDVGLSASVSVSIPTGLQSGDILIIKLDYENSFGNTDNDATISGFVSPSGWKRSVGNDYLQGLYRVLDGSEAYIGSGGTVTATMSGTNTSKIYTSPFAIAYRNADTSTPFETATGLTGSSGTGYSTTYTTGLNNEVILELVGNRNQKSITFTQPASGTIRQNRAAFGALQAGFYESPQISSAGSQSVAATFAAAVTYFGAIFVALRPLIVDTDTITTLTSLTSTESADLVDSQTIGSSTTPSGLDSVGGTDYTESASISSKTTPSSADIHAIPDVATIFSSTVLTPSEVYYHGDAATISTVTVLTSLELYLVDADVASVITTPGTIENYFPQPHGYFGIFDTDDGIIPWP